MLNLKGKLRQGMRIMGANNRDYGTIERFDNDYVYVGGRRVPHSAFERMEGDRLFVGQSGTQYFSETSTPNTAPGQSGMQMDRGEGHITVPVAEERIDVEKRQTDVGSVNVRKTVETEQVSVPVDLTRERVEVNRVDTPDRRLSGADAGAAFQEGTIRVPVRGEEAVVHKEAYVTGEVVIDKERTTERETITDTVRREHVDVDKAFDEARSGFRQHFDQRRTTGKGTANRTYEQAEPNYRMGFQSAHDQRFSGQRFEDAEPHLRREWESSGRRGSGDSWEHLRDEIREGWSRVRGR
jgi:uncharacterized protein (TIGR02271 family)